MKIKVWGCRGSITTPGPQTIRYGGNTTCVEVRGKSGCVIMVDAGSGARNFGNVLARDKKLKHISIVFTHPHWDHLVGFPFFKPAYYSRFTLQLCGGPNAQDSVKKFVSHQMESPYFPVDISVMKAKFKFGWDASQSNQVGSVTIEPVPLNHPNGGYGYKFIEDGKSFVFLTDNELGFRHPEGHNPKAYLDFCRGADILFHDAQYTDEEYKITRGWGHSTYKAAIKLAMDAGVKRLGLFHHDPDRTDRDLDRQVELCRQRLHRAASPLKCFAVAEGMSLNL